MADPSNTNGREAGARAYAALSPGIKKWVHRQGWTELRPLQVEAILAIARKSGEEGPGGDVVISAATAGGKTEAAFLPIFSDLESNPSAGEGFEVLCLSPLKALINDQYTRLLSMGQSAKVAVHRRHGDVSQTDKARALKKPAGVFITTPETLEALFVRRGREMGKWFSKLRYVVIDELHVFIGSERGKQLQSLIHRVELATRKRPPRIALSATLGDMQMAAQFLRPGRTHPAFLLTSDAEGADLQLQLRAYLVRPPKLKTGALQRAESSEAGAGIVDSLPAEGIYAVADHLFTHLRGSTNLVFANSRGRVELLSSILRAKCEDLHVPVEFFPHHGNLSKHLRESLEDRLKSDKPTTAVCTSTLELGIDIGSVHTVAQVTPPYGVASLRQRLGRSGRRSGEPAVLRMYVVADELSPQSGLSERLRLELIQSIAVVELLLKRWYEPEKAGALHLSTLVQQVISMIVQHGGVNAQQLFLSLCRHGPFRTVDPNTFTLVLRSLGKNDILQQSTDGTLLLGPEGEKISGHYTFYAAFESDREYTIVNQGRKLGSVPVDQFLSPDDHIVFGGRTWRVQDVNTENLLIQVTKSTGGTPVKFGGEVGQLHEGVVKMMRQVLAGTGHYVYLDKTATTMLAEARKAFQALELAKRDLIAIDGGVYLLPWIGDAAVDALSFALRQMEVDAVRNDRFVIIKNTSIDAVGACLAELGRREVPDDNALVPRDGTLRTAKYHYLLDEEAMARDYASLRLDAENAWKWIRGRTKVVD